MGWGPCRKQLMLWDRYPGVLDDQPISYGGDPRQPISYRCASRPTHRLPRDDSPPDGHETLRRKKGQSRHKLLRERSLEVGRASGRGRVCPIGEISGVCVSLTKKNNNKKDD